MPVLLARRHLVICDWADECDGSGSIKCECDCEHCQEDINHREECIGCDNCMPEEGEEEEAAVPAHLCKFVRSISPGFEICSWPGCGTGRREVNSVSA